MKQQILTITRTIFLGVGVSICLICAVACTTTHTAYQPANPSFKPASSGVQIYGEFDMGYGYTRKKTSR